jgi:hypothetical protein
MKRKLKTLKGIRPESVQFDNKSRLNKEQGIVKDCKILGMSSRHGYRYTAGAMKEAVGLV